MPRGEHFKKENPRINQVSFKVNDTELKALQTLAKESGVAVATWLRKQINTNDSAGVIKPTRSVDKSLSTEKVKAEVSAPRSAVKEVLIPAPKIEKLEVKKSKEKAPPANEQMSLF